MEEFRRTVVPMEEQVQTALFQHNHQDQLLLAVAPMEEFHHTAARMEGRVQTALFQHNLQDLQLLHAHMVEFHRTAVPMEELVQTVLFQHNHQGQPLPAVVLTEEFHHTAARTADKDRIALFRQDLPLLQRDQHLITNISHHALTEDMVQAASVQHNPHLHQLHAHLQLLSQDAHTAEYHPIAVPTADKVLTALFLVDLPPLR